MVGWVKVDVRSRDKEELAERLGCKTDHGGKGAGVRLLVEGLEAVKAELQARSGRKEQVRNRDR